MKEIKLTQGKVAFIDDEDFEFLNQFKWYAHKDCRTYYALRNIYLENGKKHLLSIHSVIMGKTPDGFVNDHKDGDGLNNQRYNLRFLTHRQNTQNRHDATSSKYPGVAWYKRYSKWVASIRINKKQNTLGYFNTEEEAFETYKKAVEKNSEGMLF